LATYDALPAISSDALIKGNDWKGGYFDSGHPGGEPLIQMGWVGKRFNTLDDVNPIMVLRDGQRTPFSDYGLARVSAKDSVGIPDITYFSILYRCSLLSAAATGSFTILCLVCYTNFSF